MKGRDPQLKKKILDYINGFYCTFKRAPSFQEIGDQFGVNKATAYRYVVEMGKESILEYKGGIYTAFMEKCHLENMTVPVVGGITCGDPTEEEEKIEEYINLPESIFGHGEFYILKAEGDSMIDMGIEQGDLVVVDKNSVCKKGDIVVVLNENGENTLKYYNGEENGKPILLYMNEKKYPGMKVNVDTFVCQGVAKHVIKNFK